MVIYTLLMQYDFSSLLDQVDEVKGWLTDTYAGLQSGKITPTTLAHVLVEAYGSMTRS